MSKKMLKISVAIISAFPLFLGANGMIKGIPTSVLDQLEKHPDIVASMDGSQRYLSSLLFMFGFLFYWILPKFDFYTRLFRTLLIFLFIGGLARMSSVFIYGVPGNLQLTVLGIEILVPLILVPWHISIYGLRLGHEKNKVKNESG
ncbi:DUF4345 domain-containing protein [Flavobacteriaceae bacterium 3-367]